MYLPLPGDYIDIHVHGGSPASGVFILESLMAHEEKSPVALCRCCIHLRDTSMVLNEGNHRQLLISVANSVINPEIIAIGEAGFDRLRGLQC